MCFKKDSMSLQGFVDVDLGGDLDNQKSTSCYVFMWGGMVVSWMSKLQKYLAFSTTKTEHVAISDAGKEIVLFLNFKRRMERTKIVGFSTLTAKELCVSQKT